MWGNVKYEKKNVHFVSRKVVTNSTNSEKRARIEASFRREKASGINVYFTPYVLWFDGFRSAMPFTGRNILSV